MKSEADKAANRRYRARLRRAGWQEVSLLVHESDRPRFKALEMRRRRELGCPAEATRLRNGDKRSS